MILEEFGPQVEYVQGPKNVVADALSRLDLKTKQHDEINDTQNPIQLSYVNQTDMDEVLESLFPMSPKEIRSHQEKDRKLLKSLEESDDYYLTKN